MAVADDAYASPTSGYAVGGIPLQAVHHVLGPEQSDVAGLRVAVIGINYAPEVTGIAPYTTAMCEDLAARGAQVEALVGLPHYPEWRVHRDFADQASDAQEINGVNVHRVAHHVPKRMTTANRGRYEASFLLGARRASNRLSRPDVVIAVVPALAGAVAGARLARHHDVPYGVIVQDLMGMAAAQSGISGGGRVSGLVGRIEGRAVRHAAAVAAISGPIGRAVEAYGLSPERIVHIPNYTHIQVEHIDRDEARRRLGWPTDRLIAVHTGNMGLKQDLGNVVRAAQLADDWKAPMEFRLVGDGNQRRILEEEARGVERLTFHEPTSEADYSLVLRAADILLVNERPSVGDMSLPSKLTSYLAAGRPVVAAVPPHGATSSMVETSRGGVVVAPDDPMTLLDAVLSLSSAERAKLGANGLRYAEAALTRESGLAATRRFVQWASGDQLPGASRHEASKPVTVGASDERSAVTRSVA